MELLMAKFAIGDRLTATIRDIIPPPKGNGNPKILCDVSDSEWTCSLQANAAVAKQVRLLRVGDSVDGWIIRKHEGSKFLAIGLSDFGRFPPKPDTLAEYFDGLLGIKAALIEAQQAKFVTPAPEIVAVVKGLLNRCVKKDQWDWLLIYRAFGFEDDGRAAKARDVFVRYSDTCKAVRKNKVSSDELALWSQRLLALGFLQLVETAISRLREEQAAWKAIRTPVPANPAARKTSTDQASVPNLFSEEAAAESSRDHTTLARSAGAQVRLERANMVHQLLVNTMSSTLFARGFQPLFNALIDLYCDISGQFYIFEMKSVTESNEISQIRKAVSQLYEYRFLHGLKDAQLVIVLDRKPREAWVVDYLIADRSILICWLASDRFACPPAIHQLLSQVCEPQ
jgi:hypothetical protein